MGTYIIPTTAEISENTFSLANLQIGDHIITQGYYAAGDGGGAEFEVKAGNPVAYFKHSIYGYTGWVADLVIRDGIIYADQLGAKGDAVIPASYNDPVTDVTGVNNRTDSTITANA